MPLMKKFPGHASDHWCADSLKMVNSSTLEIVFVQFREDFENFILELCFFTTNKVRILPLFFLQV